jgi:NADH-quinone oxidoreductase subunit L
MELHFEELSVITTITCHTAFLTGAHMINLIYLTILLPLAGFLINGIFGPKIKNEKVIGIIGSGTVGISFLIAVGAFFETLNLPVEQRQNIVNLFTWLKVGGLNVGFSYQVDQLSLVMALVVTGVGFIIHVYSIGYMKGDKGFWRFFSYMNLFIFAMMNLVMGDNFVLLFLGWEGVGLCSYLLIGFWYDKKFEKGTTSDAAKKAFIVNRIGDFGFLLGMFLIYLTFGSLNFNDVFTRATILNVHESTFSLIALFLFIGATGKSAQIPLFVWLPDAMAGPTPVSALIHAATMVTAGVYMVARCSIIFVSAPAIMTVVAVIGVVTALFAASIGMVQNDIKKVLAYSTISQLGYMFLATGVGAFSAGIFHLMTHAFFKALLFLGAGSVIHSMHEHQDIQQFGGLRKYMPKTAITFLIASLAISGIPPLSGFFSKDEILWMSFADGNFVYWLIGAITALMTAFYIFRLYFLTFEGKERFGHNLHPHESSSVMTIPLITLAILAAIGGFIGIPALFSGKGGNIFEGWLAPVFENAEKRLALYGTHSSGTEILLMAVSVILAVGGVWIARNIYLRKPSVAESISERFKGIYKLLWNKYFVDEIYDAAVVNPVVKSSESFLWKFTDNKIIDGMVNGTASLIGSISERIRKIQTGVAQIYAIVMMLGIVIALFWIILSL